MNPRVLRRFIVIVAVVTFLFFGFWSFTSYLDPVPGDFDTRRGDIHLSNGEWAAALEDFNAALAEEPGHRGAMMGRAIALLQMGETEQAEAELTDLIEFLEAHLRDLEEPDPTGVGALAAAYANRGIIKDRDGRHEAALADYIQALRIDEGAIDGPGLGDKIIYKARPSTVRKRAEYIEQQLKLPEEERLLSVPELDEEERMYKPSTL